MQTFTLGTRLCFGENALDALKTLGARRVLLITDKFFAENGTAQKISDLCLAETRIFAEVQPDPPLSLVAEGVRVLKEFQPDALLALGGGSAIDCAKGIRSLGQSEAMLIAVPTTSGTGSEVTSFAILTHEGVKHPLVEDALRPSLAVLDASLLDKLPAGLVADAGMDTLSHCLEAVAAKNASAFSDALAQSAARCVLADLPASYALAKSGKTDRALRGRVHEAATMAGVAFDNAGLGACHALSHALGGAFHLAHGKLNGILLPHILEFNLPAAGEAYARLAASCKLTGTRGLIFAVRRLRQRLDLPETLTQAGLERTAVLARAEEVCAAAANDPCAKTNPRPVTEADFSRLLHAAL